MNSPVITGSKKENVVDIANRMIECKVGSIVIMDEHKPVGIVTDGDIVEKVVGKNLQPNKIKAKDVMSIPLLTVNDDVDVPEAARIMRKRDVKRLGVLDNGKLMGIISISDIVSVTPEIYAIISEKARMMAAQSRGRTPHLTGFCDSCSQWVEDLSAIDGKYLCYDCKAENVSGSEIEEI
jgi:signal-transduction protein with cAMP-binding, CBS, and nucleotidyltransferase domain